MTERNKNVNKEICEERYKTINEKLVSINARINTSKESLSNRLDEINNALLGDRATPGGLLRDLKELQKDISEYEKNNNEKMEVYETSVQNKLKSQDNKIKICLIMCVLLLGGKFMGIEINNIKDYFKKETKNTKTEEKEQICHTEVPIEIQKYIETKINESIHNKKETNNYNYKNYNIDKDFQNIIEHK